MTPNDPAIRTALPTDEIHWNTYAAHPLQSWEWGQFRANMGVDVVRLIVSDTPHNSSAAVKHIKQVWQLTFHQVPLTPWTIGYFPKGPAPTPLMLRALTDLGKKKRAIFIQLEPNVIQEARDTMPNIPTLKPSHHPLFTKHTFVLDLHASEATLLSQFHPKTRYNIKVAQKHGVSITEDNSPAAFNTYLRLNEETLARQGFYAHSSNYHKEMWSIMHSRNLARLFTATYRGQILVAWIVFTWGTQLYYPYGTSSRDHRETMAPTLMLWEIIRWAKSHHFTSFDLWGALGPDPDPHDPWYGFHRFKAGFNPNLVTYAGSFDLITDNALYTGYRVADTIRWKLLKLKQRLTPK